MCEIDLETIDFLCLYGGNPADTGTIRCWLDATSKRRLVLLDEDADSLERMLECFDGHLQVKSHLIDSPLQIEPLAKKIAWQAVFLKAAFSAQEEKSLPGFRTAFEQTHLAANLLLSDAADYGVSLVKGRGLVRARRGLGLAGMFSKVPAIIIGAGPSLAKNGHLLERFRDKALLFCGGSALNATPIEPHFAASIDRQAPYRDFKRYSFWETPFCFQSRMNPDNRALIHGEALLFPDSHYAFENWIEGEDGTFDGGWTVGNFLTSIAVLLGCDPIVFVGMDLCYEGKCKYAHDRTELSSDGLIEVSSKNGKRVWTQRDWLMARGWTEELILRCPDRTFIDAREGGLDFRAPMQSARLGELVFETRGDLEHQVHNAVQSLPFVEKSLSRRVQWKESLDRCKEQIERSLFGSQEMESEEIVYSALLQPLWNVWRPIFERELDLDVQPMDLEDKLRIHRLLFFQRVIQEHCNAI